MAPSAFDGEVRVGVGETVLGHSVLADHYQRRRPNAYSVGWAVAPNSDQPCTSPFTQCCRLLN
ncbi:MAG TPA: hypothetical protein VHI11_09415 [Jiangellaceae bacterium]|nr:hypothetical protein [Jiangellaceae bacterium]